METRQAIDSFNKAIQENDIANIIKVVNQLRSIPTDLSPISEYARNDDSTAIEKCVSMIKRAIPGMIQQYLNEELKKQVTQFNDAMTRWSEGSIIESSFGTIDFNFLHVAGASIYLNITHSIYEAAIRTYARQGNVDRVNQLLERYKKEYDAHQIDLSCITESYTSTFNFPDRNSYHSKSQSVICKKMPSLSKYKESIAACMNLTIDNNQKQLAITAVENCIEGNQNVDIFSNLYVNEETVREAIVKKYVEQKKINELVVFIQTIPVQNYVRYKTFNIALEACYQANDCNQITFLLNHFKQFLNYEQSKYAAKIGDVALVATFLFPCFGYLNRTYYTSQITQACLGYTSGGFTLEKEKLEFISVSFSNACKPMNSYGEIDLAIFNQIKNINADKEELRTSLLVDCMYKKTLIGAHFWRPEYKSSTPTLKRGLLSDIFSEVKKAGVDIKALPGCENYNEKSHPPSKTTLFLHVPPRVIPRIVAKQDKSMEKKMEVMNNKLFGL